MNRRTTLFAAISAALAATPVWAKSDNCHLDKHCPGGQVCQNGRCITPTVVTIPGETQVITALGPSSQVTCRTGESPLRCCKRSVARGCRGEGGDCRKR